MLVFYSLPLALLIAIASAAPTPVDDTSSLNVIRALLSEQSPEPDSAMLSKRQTKEIYLPGNDQIKLPSPEDKAQAAAGGTVCPEWNGWIFYIAWANARCPGDA